jgi:hypothetical protein
MLKRNFATNAEPVPMPRKQYPVVKPFNEQEKLTATLLRGKRQRGSGCGSKHKGDVKSDLFLVENKLTGKLSISVKKQWMDKITREADAIGRIPMVVFGFEDGGDWATLPLSKMSLISKLMLAVEAGDLESAKECLTLLKIKLPL